MASVRHTVVVLAVLAVVATAGATQTRGSGTVTSAERIALYVSVVLSQAALVFLVQRGTSRAGASLRDVVGGRWRGAQDVLRDVAIAAAAWGLWEGFSRLALTGVRGEDTGFQGLLPTTAAEIALWILVSVAAGFAEELVFRAYLQRQLGALLRSSWAGVAAQAVAFGASHAYQGLRRAGTTALIGLLFGLITRARGSARPAMIAHAWTDLLGGLVLRG